MRSTADWTRDARESATLAHRRRLKVPPDRPRSWRIGGAVLILLGSAGMAYLTSRDTVWQLGLLLAIISVVTGVTLLTGYLEGRESRSEQRRWDLVEARVAEALTYPSEVYGIDPRNYPTLQLTKDKKEVMR